jgi:hypothetical protein
VPPDDPDATIRLPRTRGGAVVGQPGRAKAAKPPAAPAPRRKLWLAGGAAAIVLLAFGLALLLWHGRPPAPPAPVPLVPPVPAPPVPVPAPVPAPAPAPTLLPRRTEAEILAGRADQVAAMWFADNTKILVIDFPSLLAQGRAFNRIAAFVEKKGLPRDRVLNDAEMEAAIKADQATVETYYYGHDYRASDLDRFYQAVDRQSLTLWPEEAALRALLEREGLLKPGINAAVISIPREGSDPFVDASGRASLLRHELSHGEYFTDPAYGAFVKRFWEQDMTEADRDAFRGFLTRQDYEPTNQDLIINEMQAHLMHTPDIRYFNPADCGITPERIAALRAAFLEKMPGGWLHDAAAALKRQ